MLCGQCFVFLILTSLGSSEVTSFTSSFVHRPAAEEPRPTSCEPVGSCKMSGDCLEIGTGMTCIQGTCNCPQKTVLIGGKCTIEKGIGGSCRVSSECFGSGGFCNEITGKCSCASGLYEYEGHCHAGYKADVGYNLVLNLRGLNSLAFRVSDKDQQFALVFQDTTARKEVTVNFNKNAKINNETRNTVSIKEGEKTLCEGDVDPLTNLFKVDYFGPYFELDVFTSNGYSFQKVCSQINVLFGLDPTHVTITRHGDKADQNILFYPLSKEVKLVYGNLGDDCAHSHYCKIASTICDVKKKCDCMEGLVSYEGHCVQQITTLGQFCITKLQCRVRYSTCTGMGVCSCARGYTQKSPTECVPQGPSRSAPTKRTGIL